jgi:hypothetical protein
MTKGQEEMCWEVRAGVDWYMERGNEFFSFFHRCGKIKTREYRVG